MPKQAIDVIGGSPRIDSTNEKPALPTSSLPSPSSEPESTREKERQCLRPCQEHTPSAPAANANNSSRPGDSAMSLPGPMEGTHHSLYHLHLLPTPQVSLSHVLLNKDGEGRYSPAPHSNAYYPPHKHSGLTTHLIRHGTLTITYPDDNDTLHNGEVKKETFGAGARVDVPAGKLHEVWMGESGCEYVIGE